MNNNELNIISELKILTMSYDLFKIDNQYDLKAFDWITGAIRKDNYIIYWNFNTKTRDGLLALYIDHKSSNIVYYNKAENPYYKFENSIKVENEDYNKFLTIFKKLYDSNNK